MLAQSSKRATRRPALVRTPRPGHPLLLSFRRGAPNVFSCATDSGFAKSVVLGCWRSIGRVAGGLERRSGFYLHPCRVQRSLVALQRNATTSSPNGPVVTCSDRVASLRGSEESVGGCFPGVSKTPPPATNDQLAHGESPSRPFRLTTKACCERPSLGLQTAEELRSLKYLFSGGGARPRNDSLCPRLRTTSLSG